jgi:2-succinyl-5-enolpyruvyl-6-hydroxy-3-cyclohexene-1-carboxylate synthase
MESRLKNINSFWGYLLIDELVRNGITRFCISPGSRSTPLTIAAAENPNAENIVSIDERGSAFYALGYGRATGKPAVIICTSGTAAANYYPAIIEAHQSDIPLIVLTADRPPELRSTGANQTIDQVKMFSDYPKWYFDVPCPNLDISPEMVLTTVDQAICQSLSNSPGPVHLNCMFREPLEPTNRPFPRSYYKSLRNWMQTRLPYTNYQLNYNFPDQTGIENLAHQVNSVRKGILVVGELPDGKARKAVVKLAVNLRWPVFADITSGLQGESTSVPIIKYFDQILVSDKIRNHLRSKIIIHIGKALTSKRFLQFIQNHPPQAYVQVRANNKRQDPSHQVSQYFYCDIGYFCDSLGTLVRGNTDKNWHMHIQESDIKIGDVLENYLYWNSTVSEVSLPVHISRSLNPDHGLFLASSMPIRDFDMFADFKGLASRISANRGASGIDGTVASAVGFSSGLNKPVTVVLGDLALIHDMNSLLLVDGSENPITLVVINNGGGGIFSFLPVSKYAHIFEQYFGTVHDYNFKYIARMFNLKYSQPSTNKEFLETYKKCASAKKSSIIEIKTERDKNLSLHLDIQKRVKAVLEK